MTDVIKTQKVIQPSVKVRNSNLELFRILTMISIIAHHYVVNSGLTAADGIINSNPTSLHSLVLLVVGAWGKIGINSFVLITGYFMCKSNITLNKFLKLLLEVMLYRIIIHSVFWITGYSEFSIKALIKILIPVVSIKDGFTGAYIVFFLFIPFLNILVNNINERQHIKLLLLCGFMFIFLGTIPYFSVTFNYVSWFIVLYFISSYFRLYPKSIFENTKLWGLLLVASTLLCIISVLVCVEINWTPYYFVVDSNKALAVIEAVCAFMFFKNIKIKNSKIINVIASATFGVFLIHTNGDNMRSWLWGDLLNVVGTHSTSNGYLHIVLSILGVYIVCTVIDIIRIYLIEKPFFKLWNKKTINLNKKYISFENKLCEKFHIE